MRFPVVPGLSWLALLLGLSLQAQAQTFDIEYRHWDGVQRSIQRSLDGGETWHTMREGSSVWLVWDQQAPAHVCTYGIAVYWVGYAPWIHCSWNAGGTWYKADLENGMRREVFEQLPTFASDLQVDPTDEDTLLLTAYDRIFRLERGANETLRVDEEAVLPVTAGCDAVPNSQVCANQALENISAVWYDPARSGQGLTLVGRGGDFWGYFTTYDEFGDAHWYLFQFSAMKDGTDTVVNNYGTRLIEFHGPPLDSNWDPALVQGTPVGGARIRLISPRQIIFTHYLNAEPVTLNLVPFE